MLLLLLVGGAAWLATDGGDPSTSSRSPVSPSNEPSNPAPPVPVPAAAPNTPEDEATTSASETDLVPSATGLTVSQAAQMIRAAGLRLRIELEASSRPAGTVIGQEPSAGERVERGSVVDLRVARPERQAPRIVSVPSLVGSTVAAAKSRLRELGLRWSVSEVASDETGGTVVDSRRQRARSSERARPSCCRSRRARL